MVRAKFEVTKISDANWKGANGEDVRSVELYPVCDGSPENKSFFAATPGGRIELGCANLKAVEQFEEGKEYYVDFTPAL